jgi:hypothetical protein
MWSDITLMIAGFARLPATWGKDKEAILASQLACRLIACARQARGTVRNLGSGRIIDLSRGVE